MRVYRYEKDLTGVNGKSFGEVSESNSRYFAKTFKGAIMWGFLFNTLHPEVKIYDGYIVEYEINGEYFERQINSYNACEYTEIKIKHSNCLIIKRTYVVIDRFICIDENKNEYETPPFIEEFYIPERLWIKKNTKN